MAFKKEENTFFSLEIPPDIRRVIKEEAQKDIAPILEEDPKTAEFYKEAMTDYRTRAYRFLSWIRDRFSPSSVLYPVSGFDRMPKLVFGEKSVVHTSLEEYEPIEGEKYFGDLGKGKKVVADNIALPFPDSEFQAVVLFGLSFKSVAPQRGELVRILKKRGVMIVGRNILTDFGSEEAESWQNFAQGLPLESLSTPDEFQGGDLETEFLIFVKKSGLK